MNHAGFTLDQYRRVFGWRIDGTALTLGDGIVAVTVRPATAVNVISYLRQQDICGPVLDIAAPAGTLVFLADANGMVLAEDELPPGIGLLSCPHTIPLPVPSRSTTRWIVPPSLHRRWLPTLAAVIAAIRGCEGSSGIVARRTAERRRPCAIPRRPATILQ